MIGMLMLSNWYGIQAQKHKREAKRLQINEIERQLANDIKKPQSVIDETMEDKKMALKILKLELKGIPFFDLDIFLLSLLILVPLKSTYSILTQIWTYSGRRKTQAKGSTPNY